MLPNEKIYWQEAITTILWPYAMNSSAEQLNESKVDGDGITPMKKFSGTTIDINL